MRRIMENQKSVEGEEILKLLSAKQLEFLKELYEQGGNDLVEIFDLLAMRAKETIYVLSKERKSVDQLIEVAQKQNFQAGRVSVLILLDYLVSHSGKKLEGKDK